MRIYCILALAFALLQGGTATANAQDPPEWLTKAIISHESAGNPRAICFNKITLLTPTPEEAARISQELDALGLQYTVRPKGITVDLQSLRPATVEDGRRIVRKADELGLSIDIGLGQINIQHPRRHGFDAEKLLEPDFNKEWCRKLLAGALTRHGQNWRAVGFYNSPEPERGRVYEWLISYAARRIEGENPHGKVHGTTQRDHGVPDAGGIRRGNGQRQAGEDFPVKVPETGQHRPTSEKP